MTSLACLARRPSNTGWGQHPDLVITICTLPEQPPSALYYFLNGLRRFLMGWEWKYLYQSATVKPPTSRAIPQRGLPLSHHYLLYATLVQSVINWPEEFYKFLDAFKYRNYPPTHIGFGRLTPHWLRRTWSHPTFQFVRDAFDEYVRTRHPDRPTRLPFVFSES